MVPTRWSLLARILILACLMLRPAAGNAGSPQSFRQENGLMVYEPPSWFLEGHFVAREKDPAYVFGPISAFLKTLGCKTTWLIEDQELRRLDQASDGKEPEYSLYLEAVWPDRTEYFVFVALPYENAKAWYDARRAYHGRKTEDYYGETQRQVENAMHQGLRVKAELRFLIEHGDISLAVPEDLIKDRYKCRPVFDLRAGREIGGAERAK